MLIGYVLVLVLNGSSIEPVTDNVLTWAECQAALKVELLYHPENKYGCADVYRDENAPE